MKTFFAALTAVALSASASAAVVTQWNFNGSTANLTPSTGAGSVQSVGSVTFADGNGASNGGSSDPVGNVPTNRGLQTTTYAAQGTNSGGAGVQFNVSTVGYDSIVITWDQRHSNTSSRWVQLQYSLDGVNFTAAGLAGDGLFQGTSGDTWFNGRSVDLSSIAGAANNANFAFRIVAVFAPNTNAYAPSTSTSSYATSGTWRFDMVTLSGNVVPAPGALALLAAGGLVMGRRRR
ncbi:MAG: hypothetical protein U0636_03830 [Phycisphaerales bacterium]